MQPSPDGLAPMDGFLEKAMAPRPSFNDMSSPQGAFHKTSPHGQVCIDMTAQPVARMPPASTSAIMCMRLTSHSLCQCFQERDQGGTAEPEDSC